MAVEVTPLGFKKPDGNELFRKGDNLISDNAQKAQDLIANARGRLALVETTINAAGFGPGMVEDPDDMGTYIYLTPRVSEDPADPGTFLLGA